MQGALAGRFPDAGVRWAALWRGSVTATCPGARSSTAPGGSTIRTDSRRPHPQDDAQGHGRQGLLQTGDGEFHACPIPSLRSTAPHARKGGCNWPSTRIGTVRRMSSCGCRRRCRQCICCSPTATTSGRIYVNGSRKRIHGTRPGSSKKPRDVEGSRVPQRKSTGLRGGASCATGSGVMTNAGHPQALPQAGSGRVSPVKAR